MAKLTPNFDINSFVKGNAETRKNLIRGFSKSDLQKLCKRINVNPEGHSAELFNRLVHGNH